MDRELEEYKLISLQHAKGLLAPTVDDASIHLLPQRGQLQHHQQQLCCCQRVEGVPDAPDV